VSRCTLLVVSAVRDEEAHIERTAAALQRQRRQPDLWLVVDDGSSDRTPQLLAALRVRLPFMRTLSMPQCGKRARDGLAEAREIAGFDYALASVHWRSYTHIAKLDGDIELPGDYFDQLLARFARDPLLGLAGGVYAERCRGGRSWRVQSVPNEHHVAGALKCYTRECLVAIGGLQERLGWDTIDETYARMCGFRTRSFPDLIAFHHRPWGSASGRLRGRARHGACAYITHYPLPWILARSLKVALARPRGLSGAAFVAGYLHAAALRVERVPDKSYRSFVRHELRGRLRRAPRALLRGRAQLEAGTAPPPSHTFPDQVVTAQLK